MRRYLAEFLNKKKSFKNLSKEFDSFKTSKFKSFNDLEKLKKISHKLLELIEKEKKDSFLLFEVLDFINKIKKLKILENYNLNFFELWLNQYSGLNFEKNYQVRAKIAGKYIPRVLYEKLFPIGMNKVYEGSHFVSAHKSPDLDSIIASFWGWLDSFAAKVSENLHFWNVPGGILNSFIEVKLLFEDFFGKEIFDLSKTKQSLTLTALDIMKAEDMVLKTTKDYSMDIQRHHGLKAVVIVDDNGNYLADWRSYDVEDVRQIIFLLNNCLRWFESNLQLSLISLFTKKNLKEKDSISFIKKVFGNKIKNSEPTKEYNENQKKLLDSYLKKVFLIENGLNATFEEFIKKLYISKLVDSKHFLDIFNLLTSFNLFDKDKNLIENRIKIFEFIEKIIKSLNLAFQSIRSYIEKLDVALKIKSKVFGFNPHFVSYKSDIEEIKMKIDTRSYLTINMPFNDKNLPLGIVKATTLNKKFLGTVSIRDFSNFFDLKIPNYLEVISIIDHHKSSINTKYPSSINISDCQSSNTIVAELAMQINDQYSLSGMSKKDILDQLNKKNKNTTITTNLLKKKSIIDKKSNYYINYKREFVEYLHFLFGILDDTDLLMKVTRRDLVCVVNLLNRLKTISLKKETQLINLDDIPEKDFIKKATKKILSNQSMYFLYKNIYNQKEKELNKNILQYKTNKSKNLFSDIKEFAFCKVSQTKMFLKNIKNYLKYSNQIKKKWIENIQRTHKEKPSIDMYIHMVSTIKGADEVYKNKETKYKHKDELWFWIAKTDLALEHLKNFLISFSKSIEDKSIFSLELLGDNADLLKDIFKETFYEDISISKKSKKLDIAVLYFDAGLINSRKSMISPHLSDLSE